MPGNWPCLLCSTFSYPTSFVSSYSEWNIKLIVCVCIYIYIYIHTHTHTLGVPSTKDLHIWFKIYNSGPIYTVPVAQWLSIALAVQKVVDSIPKEQKCIAWMYCKSLWIKASAKCINVYIKRPKCFEITCTLPDQEKTCLSNASLNLSLFKDLNPCRHAPLSVTDYEKWNLNYRGVVGFIHAC